MTTNQARNLGRDPIIHDPRQRRTILVGVYWSTWRAGGGSSFCRSCSSSSPSSWRCDPSRTRARRRGRGSTPSVRGRPWSRWSGSSSSSTGARTRLDRARHAAEPPRRRHRPCRIRVMGAAPTVSTPRRPPVPRARACERFGVALDGPRRAGRHLRGPLPVLPGGARLVRPSLHPGAHADGAADDVRLRPRPAGGARIGNRSTMASGIFLGGAGLVLMATFVSVDGGYLSILPGMLAMRLGMGVTMTPSTEAITTALPRERQGRVRAQRRHPGGRHRARCLAARSRPDGRLSRRHRLPARRSAGRRRRHGPRGRRQCPRGRRRGRPPGAGSDPSRPRVLRRRLAAGHVGRRRSHGGPVRLRSRARSAATDPGFRRRQP